MLTKTYLENQPLTENFVKVYRPEVGHKLKLTRITVNTGPLPCLNKKNTASQRKWKDRKTVHGSEPLGTHPPLLRCFL